MEALSSVGSKPWFLHAHSVLSGSKPLPLYVGGPPRCFHMKASNCTPSPNTPTSQKKMFIFGLGFVGLSFARHILDEHHNWDVMGTCSSEEKSLALQNLGLHAFKFNSDNDGEELNEEGILALSNATHIVTTIPPVADFDKDPVLSMYRNQIADLAMSKNLRWIGYLSSTGVYGDHGGAWVNENTRTNPVNKRGVARREAEEAWLQLGAETCSCVQVFRLGGIYGPGRSAINTILSSSELSMKQHSRETRQHTSRIHVKDICRVLMASIESPFSGRIYNVVDDDPASRAEVFSYARMLIDEKWPSKLQYVEIGDTKVAGSYVPFQRAEKKVANKRMKDELQIELLYPSYKSGLKAIIDEKYVD